MWLRLSTVLTSNGTKRRENPAWVCRTVSFCVSQPLPDLLCSTMSNILDKTAKASVFSVCRYSPERKLTGGSPSLQTSATCLKGPCSSPLFLSFAGSQHHRTTPVLYFFPFFFLNHFPLLSHVVVAFSIVPVKTLWHFYCWAFFTGLQLSHFAGVIWSGCSPSVAQHLLGSDLSHHPYPSGAPAAWHICSR